MRVVWAVALIVALLETAARADDPFDDSLRRFQVKEHDGAVTAVAIAPDGKTLATGGKDKTIRFFDLATGKRTNLLRRDDAIWALAYSADGLRFAASDGGRKVVVWDAKEWKEKATFKDFEAPVAALALSPDGSQLATVEDGLQAARVWEVESGKVRQVLEGHGDRINGVAFSPDGKRLVTAGDDETARVWEAAAGQPGKGLRGHDGPVAAAVFTPDGKTVVTAGARDKTVRLWDVAELKAKAVLEGHAGGVYFVGAAGPDGAVVSLSADGTVKLWNADGKETASFRWAPGKAEAPPAAAVALAADGKTLAVARGGVVDVWDLEKAKKTK